MTTAATAAPPVDVEDVLRRGGLTSFHRRAVLVTGMAWTFVAMEILLVGFVAPIFTQIWNLNGTWQGLVNSAALAGSLVGSLTLGRLADRIGRRAIFQYAILWYAVFTALTAFAWGPWSVMTLRFLAGLGLGGLLVVDPSMLAEYLPPQRRGRLLVFLDFWWPVGLLLATGLSYIFLGPTFDRFGDWSWRYLFLAAAFPAFLAFLVRRTLPESPYYPRCVMTALEEAAEVLSEIEGKPVARPTSRCLPSRIVHARPCRRTPSATGRSSRRSSGSPSTSSYYGLFLWLPFVLQSEKSFHVNVYLLLTLSALSQFPGYAAAIWLVEKIGRKTTLAVVPHPGRALRLRVRDRGHVGRLHHGPLLRRLLQPRRVGCGLPLHRRDVPDPAALECLRADGGVGKSAAIAGPYIFGHLNDATGDTTWSLTFIAIVMAAGGVIAAIFSAARRAASIWTDG